MRLSKRLGIAAGVLGFVGVVASSVAPASAVTITVGGTAYGGGGLTSTVPGATTIDFNSGLPTTTGLATYTFDPGIPVPSPIVSGTLPGNYAQPVGPAPASQYLTIAPNGSGIAGQANYVKIAFAKGINYFGLHWGSVDTYNSIEFFKNNISQGIFTGSQVPGSTASGSQVNPNDNPYVNFFANPTQSWDEIRLSTTGVAFESDNHAYNVPEPTTILGSLMTAGFLINIKRKQLRKAFVKN